MAHHYHIEMIDHMDRSMYGSALPFDSARKDAKAMAEEHNLPRIAGGVYGFGDGLSGNRIIINPCDNPIDFDLAWDYYRNPVTQRMEPAPRGQSCSSAIKEAYWCFLSRT